ncbi:MFS transporter [Jatrophihabitans telluris]|uniref:MFS transporter n=1 Tax=Jatrophihabitans telluris TaxID=2038343 RepID=A0ABY4R1A0_9ACTN|nr:MDR family MFS transporter [Jatrophihabitans telluris]UQX88906.1 MFS transporter [Jatrophihabitans telluris]
MAEPVQMTPDASGRLSHRQIMLILSGLLLGMFLAALDQTIVSAAMRTIADKLNGQTNQAWATTAYLVTSTVSTPLYGKLSDMYGRKKFYLFAISIFLVGSALSGMANSMIELAGFRAVQGLGAGGLMALAFAIIGDIVPPRERAKYQGYFMAVFGLSSVAGPVLGGLLAGQDTLLGVDGWRWVFYVNLPIGIVALAVVSRFLNLPHTRQEHRIDYWGAVTLVLGITSLLVVAEQGRVWGWGSGRSILMYVIGVGLIAAFVYIERAVGDEAILPLKMFKHPVFSVASLMNFIVGMGMFGGIICLPLYMQIVKGFSPTKSGLSLLPLMLGLMTVAMASGIATAKTGRYKLFPIVGTGLLILALSGLSRITAHTSYAALVPLMVLVGAGLGCCMQTLVLATQNSVPASQMGVATASATFFRSMGGTFGTALFLTVFFSVSSTKVGENVKAVVGTPQFQTALKDPSNSVIAKALTAMKNGSTSQLNDTSFLQHGAAILRDPFLNGFASAMDRVFLLAALVVVPAFVLSFFLKEVKLRMESGLEARAAEEAAAKAAADRSLAAAEGSF